MGFFDMIKKAFRPEEEPQEIRFNELRSWLESQSDKKQVLENIKDSIRSIEDDKREIEERIDILLKAEVPNKKTPERALRILDDHRDVYMQKVRWLSSDLVFPETHSFEQITKACDSNREKINEFGNNTQKNYRVLQEFLANESFDVAEKIKSIDNHILDIKNTIKHSKVKVIESLNEELDKIIRSIDENKQNKERNQEIEKEIAELKDSISEFEEKIISIKNSKDYEQHSNKLDRIENLKRRMKLIEDQRFHHFSVINSALKKYERIALESRLISDYVDDSFNALSKDKELKIVTILDKMKKAINSGKLELKDKKKEKILKTLEILDREYLLDFLEKYNDFDDKIKLLEKETSDSEVMKKLDETESRLKHKREHLQRLIDEKDSIQRSIDEFYPEKRKQELKEDIIHTLGKDIEII